MKLPSPIEVQLLSLVSAHELAGREVAKRFNEETGRSISYGTLYTAFRRLKESGWVSVRDDQDQDGRVRYFKITGSGAHALDEAREFHKALSEFGIKEGGQAWAT